MASLVVDADAKVCELQSDFRQMLSIGDGSVIVTARADDEGIDFVSPVFCLGVGIDEYPVSGSAHCPPGDLLGREAGPACSGHGRCIVV